MRRNDGQMAASRTQSHWKSIAQRQTAKEKNAARGQIFTNHLVDNRNYRTLYRYR